MLKLAGCILIFISCCTLGMMKAHSFKIRTRELESILESIKLLELEIWYKKEPLASSFRRAARQKPCWFSDVMESCSAALSKQQPLQESWNQALERNKRASPLDAQDMEILHDMALGLGKSDADGQKRILEMMKIRMETRLEDARRQEEKQGKMYKGLGISAGVVLVIMII